MKEKKPTYDLGICVCGHICTNHLSDSIGYGKCLYEGCACKAYYSYKIIIDEETGVADWAKKYDTSALQDKFKNPNRPASPASHGQMSNDEKTFLINPTPIGGGFIVKTTNYWIEFERLDEKLFRIRKNVWEWAAGKEVTWSGYQNPCITIGEDMVMSNFKDPPVKILEKVLFVQPVGVGEWPECFSKQGELKDDPKS